MYAAADEMRTLLYEVIFPEVRISWGKSTDQVQRPTFFERPIVVRRRSMKTVHHQANLEQHASLHNSGVIQLECIPTVFEGRELGILWQRIGVRRPHP